jgi:CTP synthase
LRKERAFEYGGITVQPIPHITNEIISRIEAAGAALSADIVMIELGGTVGDYENVLFFEASRIMKLRHPADVFQIHLGYLPIPGTLGEMKSKPIQQSVRALNAMGIQPDMIIGRSTTYIDKTRREKISLFCNVLPEDVISNPDVPSIYEVPMVLDRQQVAERLLEKCGLPVTKKNLRPWKSLVKRIEDADRPIRIGLVGKYFATGDFVLEDVYVSVIEALKHAAWSEGLRPELIWIDSEKVESEGVGLLEHLDGVVVPGGFGSRGTEGMISTICHLRQQEIPFLGLCYGLQMATIEFARHVAGLDGANSTEVAPKNPHPVVHIMPEQEKKLLHRDYGASMRLGGWECVVKAGTLARKAYGRERISERHRHRYEVNNHYREQLERAGLVVSGTSPDGQLVEIIELPDHPFFVASQFHPEFQSKPTQPHPLFVQFMKASSKIGEIR